MADWISEALDELDSVKAVSTPAMPETKPDISAPEADDAWIGSALDEIDSQKSQSVNNVIDFAIRKNPDQAAKDQKISKKLGISLEAVEADREKATAEYEKLFFPASIQVSPTLEQKMMNPDFASVAHDDHENLAKLDNDIKAISGLMFSDNKKLETLTFGAPDKSLIGNRGPIIDEYGRATHPEASKDKYFEYSQELKFDQQHSESMSDSFNKGLTSLGVIGELGGYGIDKFLSSAGALFLPVPEGMEDDPNWKDKIKLTSGAVEASLSSVVSVYGSLPYDKRTEIAGRLFEEKGVTDAVGYFMSNPSALVNFLTEQVPTSVAGGGVGGAVGSGIAKKIAVNKAIKESTKHLITKYLTLSGASAGGTFAGDLPAEFSHKYKETGDADTALSYALVKSSTDAAINAIISGIPIPEGDKILTKAISYFTELAKQGVGGSLGAASASLAVGEEPSKGEMFLEFFAGFGTAPVDLAVTSLLTKPSAKKEDDDAIETATAEATKEKLVQLGESVKGTKTYSRSPETTAEFVKESAKEGDVYINIDEFVGYWQSSKEGEIEAIVDSIQGLNEKIEDAIISNGDIKISLADYASKIAPTAHNEGFSEITRLRQEDISLKSVREKAESMPVKPEKTEEEIKTRQSAEMVKNQFINEQVATKKYNRAQASKPAALLSAFSKIIAKELGVKPHEAYAKYTIKIQAAKIKPTEAYAQPPVYKAAENAVTKSGLQKGTARQWKEVLGKAPVETLKWLDTKKSEVSKDEVIENIKQNAASEQLLFQDQRGGISFGAGIGIDPSIITILENADMSTVSHELAHYFFEVMNDIAKTGKASKRLQKDLDTLVKFAGAKSIEEWNSMSFKDRENGHEKVAEAFEDYLIEGKAPSAELKNVFQRLRDWMLDIYKSIKRDIRLTDDVRDVFDRMLASQDAIDSAKIQRQYQEMFDSAEQAGWTDEAFEKYNESVENFVAEAKDKLQLRLINDMKWLSGAKHKKIAALQAEAAEKRAAMREEVSKEVNELRVYKAIETIKSPEVKLHLESLREMYPDIPQGSILEQPPDWESLGYGKNGMLSEDGMHPQVVAQLSGYTSADEMINDILKARPIDDVITEETDKRMFEKYGDITNPKLLEQAANEALHNSVRERILEAEYSAITRAMGAKKATSKATKAYAEASIKKLKVRDIKPSSFMIAEAAAAKKAEKAIFDGDINAAAEAKLSQIINHKKYKAAIAALKEIDKKIEYLKRFDKETIRKLIDGEYLDQIDEILRSFDIRKSESLKNIDKRESLAAFIQSQVNLGLEVAIDKTKIEEIKKKHYKNMTLSELTDIVDTVKHIDSLGKLKKDLLIARKYKTRKEAADALNASIAENATKELPEKASATHLIGKFIDGANAINSMQRMFGSLINQLDGFKAGGAAFELLWRNVSDAAAKEFGMRHDSTETLVGLYKNLGHLDGVLPKNIYAISKVVPGTNISMTHEQRLMLVAYWGDPNARQRILDNGIAGHRALTQEEVNAVINTMTEKDIAWIKGVWKHLESFRPLITEQVKRTNGVEPKWINPEPFETKFGVMEGGYMPLNYDRKLAKNHSRFEAMAQMRPHMTGILGDITTKDGYEQARSDEVKNKPLLLSFDIISRHINDVTHRLAWEEVLIDAKFLLNDIEETVKKHHGNEVYDSLTRTFLDIAEGDTSYEGPYNTFFSYLRSGAVIAGIGWNVLTGALQPTGYIVASKKIGSGWMMRGLAKAHNPVKAYKEAVALSEPLKQRWHGTMQREINETVNRSRRAKRSFIEENAMIITAKMQMLTDLPVFHGAYEKYIAELGVENAKSEEERNEISAKASDMAYKAVIDTQGGGHIHEQAEIFRNKYLKIFTVFANYMNMLWNNNVELFKETEFKNFRSYPGFAVDFMLINIFPVLATVAIRQLARNDCESWDNIECLVKKYEKEQLSTFTGQGLLLREAHIGLEAAMLGEASPFGYTGPGGLRIFAELTDLGKQIGQGDADIALAKAGIDVAGIVLHQPSAQINKTMEGILSVSEGKSRTAGEIVRAVLFGPPKDQK
jgi:Large polyvalent protein associated domain 22